MWPYYCGVSNTSGTQILMKNNSLPPMIVKLNNPVLRDDIVETWQKLTTKDFGLII